MSALQKLLQAKKQEIANKDNRTAKVEDGSSRWRIMGSWRGEGQQFWHDFGQHYVKGADGKVAAVYICQEKTYGKPCGVCEAIAAGLRGAEGDEHATKLINDAKAGARILLNAVRTDEHPDAGKVVILEVPVKGVFDPIIKIASEWEDAGETIIGSGGKDLIITRTGKGLNTTYNVQVAPRSKAIDPSLDKKLHDLDAFVASTNPESLNRAINGVRAVAGMLPAPASSVARLAGASIDDDVFAAPAAVPTPKAAVPTVDFEDVPSFEETPAPAPKAKAAPAPKAAAPAADDDLDAIQASLDV